MRRRDLLATGFGAPAVWAQGPRRPNIVWIMADDLAWAEVGCYGQKIIQTPNIDRLAREGTRFTDAYAGCTVCAPSRSVLMTGKHMGHTAVRSNPGGVPLPQSETTVATVLKSAGYTNGLFGKWGLGDIGTEGVPWRHGFDRFFGFLHQAHAHYHYPPYLYDNDKQYPLAGNRGGATGDYAPDLIARRAVEFIRQNKANPFFCYAAFTLPHVELAAPAELRAKYLGKVKEEGTFSDKAGRLLKEEAPRATFAAMVERLDQHVGWLLDQLKVDELDRDTLVFFTSDNGGMARQINADVFDGYGPWRGHKTNFYEGGIRTPMIARWPGRIAANRTSDFVWMFQDFLPTAAEVAGAEAPSGLDGFSVLPTLLGKTQQPHPWLYWELPQYLGVENGGFREEPRPLQALRMGHWKAVRPKPGGPAELYELRSDPGETKDLAALQDKVLARMEAIMLEQHRQPAQQTQPDHPWWSPIRETH